MRRNCTLRERRIWRSGGPARRDFEPRHDAPSSPSLGGLTPILSALLVLFVIALHSTHPRKHFWQHDGTIYRYRQPAMPASHHQNDQLLISPSTHAGPIAFLDHLLPLAL